MVSPLHPLIHSTVVFTIKNTHVKAVLHCSGINCIQLIIPPQNEEERQHEGGLVILTWSLPGTDMGREGLPDNAMVLLQCLPLNRTHPV